MGGPRFMSSLFSSLCSYLGVSSTPTCAYHPETNGLIERAHRTIKTALRIHADKFPWTRILPWILLSLQSTPRADDGKSAFETVFGTPAVLPGQLIDDPEQATDVLLRLLQDQPAAPVRVPPPQPLRPLPPDCSHVYVREEAAKKSALSPLYRGPYTVLRRTRNTVRLRMGDREDTVAVARVKPCRSIDPVPAVPPHRGRPRGRTL